MKERSIVRAAQAAWLALLLVVLGAGVPVGEHGHPGHDGDGVHIGAPGHSHGVTLVRQDMRVERPVPPAPPPLPSVMPAPGEPAPAPALHPTREEFGPESRAPPPATLPRPPPA